MDRADLALGVRLLQAGDIEEIVAAFRVIGWDKPVAQYKRYLAEQQNNVRSVQVAFAEGEFAGYLTILWVSEYSYFAEKGIPEIQDFNVLPKFRRRGIGNLLLEMAEQVISTRSAVAGIGVGMTADYGAAQRLYMKRSYVADGNGLFSKNLPVKYGEQVTVDDDLTLYFTKDLSGVSAE